MVAEAENRCYLYEGLPKLRLLNGKVEEVAAAAAKAASKSR